MSGSVPTKESNILISLSRGMCGLCQKELHFPGNDSGTLITTGVVAHIRGKRPGSARFDSLQSNDDRNSYSNLIYLCNDCHALIDKQESNYPTDYLLQKKREHEEWAGRVLSEALPVHEHGTIDLAGIAAVAKEIKIKPEILAPILSDLRSNPSSLSRLKEKVSSIARDQVVGFLIILVMLVLASFAKMMMPPQLPWTAEIMQVFCMATAICLFAVLHRVMKKEELYRSYLWAYDKIISRHSW